MEIGPSSGLARGMGAGWRLSMERQIRGAVR